MRQLLEFELDDGGTVVIEVGDDDRDRTSGTNRRGRD
jgi:hypothetical protein